MELLTSICALGLILFLLCVNVNFIVLFVILFLQLLLLFLLLLFLVVSFYFILLNISFRSDTLQMTFLILISILSNSSLFFFEDGYFFIQLVYKLLGTFFAVISFSLSCFLLLNLLIR
jgi:hypothetical protein